MPLRRRARQVLVEIVRAMSDRIVAVLDRLHVGPQRLVVSGATSGASGRVAFRRLHPPLDIPPAVPELVDGDACSVARYRELHETWGEARTSDAGVVTARDVRVSMPTGAHRWRGRMFGEGLISVEALRNPKYLAAFAAMMVVGATDLAEGVLLSLPWNHNFYHWLVEMLPRLQLVDEVPELQAVPLLVPVSAPAFVTESLRITGYDDRALHLDDGVYRVDTLHIPSPLSTASDVSPLALEWLDARFPRVEPKGRRIYVSRADSPVRYVANDHDVASVLAQEFGFETIVMSQLPLDEQVRTFRESDVIVGAHGAAFAHLAFAPRGATFVEFFQDGHFNHCYGRMAAIRGLRYGFVVAERHNLGMRVDLDAVRRVTRAIVDRDDAPDTRARAARTTRS